MFRSMVFGFCLPTRNCSCPLINSLGFERGRLNSCQTLNGLAPTISIGRGWMSIYRYSPYEIHPYFRWFRAQWANSLLVTDTPQQVAASRRLLRAGGLQRYLA